ncbi:MAG: hypothetical protein AAGA48_00945 [Myxococcota bacterium]
MRFWTASTRPLESLDYPGVYDLSGQTGEGFSHGIFCLAVLVGPVQGCVGWDAEGIRNLVQNEFIHRRVVNDGIIPTVDRPGRPYLRLTLNPNGLAF